MGGASDHHEGEEEVMKLLSDTEVKNTLWNYGRNPATKSVPGPLCFSPSTSTTREELFMDDFSNPFIVADGAQRFLRVRVKKLTSVEGASGYHSPSGCSGFRGPRDRENARHVSVVAVLLRASGGGAGKA